jgi:hypothetical protein
MDMGECGYEEIIQKMAQMEPNLYSDYSNALNFHLEVFRKLLRRYESGGEEEAPIKEEERK